MKTFLKSAVAACVLATAPLAASASTIIDFDALVAGPLQDVPLLSFEEDGFTFGLTFSRESGGGRQGVAGPAIFDSANPVNGDNDLSPISQGDNGVSGNVLILQEAGAAVPDDAGSAGTITLTLLSGPAFSFLGASAIDNTDFTFSSIIGGTTTELGTIDIDVEGDQRGGTGMLTFDTASDVIGVGDSIFIEYGGSGGVDSLQIAAVPLPAALPMMLVGLGGLGALARRRKKRS
ncbi:MAG: VPLPA-CTERM sorting domain-containing protein [Roseobacter sp.]